MADGKRPNILLIFPDQQRFDCIGRSGIYPVKTPHIDRLAREGAWFMNAYTPQPLCCPARQALLNGQRPEKLGSYWNYDFGITGVLQPEDHSWPRELQAQGYRTGYAGKWHVNPEYDPTSFGFDTYYSNDDYYRWRHEAYPEVPTCKTEFKELPKDDFRSFVQNWKGEVDPIETQASKTHWMAQKVIEMIHAAETAGKPWHIRLDFEEPHLPCCPTQEFMDWYDPAKIPQWASFPDPFIDKPYIQKQQLMNWNLENYTWEDWAPIVARYYAIISQIDDAIGMVLQELENLGLCEQTMVVYVPDHGDLCGGHGMMDKQYNMYEDIVHVPMCIRWPGKINPGTVIEEYVYSVLDLQPTILDYLQLPIPSFYEGRSLRPLLEGEQPSDWRKEIVSYYNGMQFGLYTQRMLLSDGWKYIWNTTDVDELYHLPEDPAELHNRIYDPTLAERIQNMRRKLYELLITQGDFLAKSSWMGYQLLNNKKL